MVHKNLDDQAISGWPKTVYYEVLIQAIGANTVSGVHRVAGKFGISQASLVSDLHDLSKSIRIVPHFTKKYFKTFDLPLYKLLSCVHVFIQTINF